MSDGSFASLNPSLLARKGGARPAMRPQLGALAGMSGLTGVGAAATAAAPNPDDLDDLGWNDMGEDHDVVRESEPIHLTPAPANEETAAQAIAHDEKAQAEIAGGQVLPQVRVQQESIADRLTGSVDEKSEPAPISSAVPSNMPPNTPSAVPHTAQAPADISAATPENTGKTAVRQKAATAAIKPAIAKGKRAAFTLRLDPERHLKLRLASALKNRSAQAIVTQALDALLAEIEDLDLMANKAGAGN